MLPCTLILHHSCSAPSSVGRFEPARLRAWSPAALATGRAQLSVRSGPGATHWRGLRSPQISLGPHTIGLAPGAVTQGPREFPPGGPKVLGKDEGLEGEA